MATVFFDVDHTIVHRSTARLAFEYYIERGKLSRFLLFYGMVYAILHFLDLMNERQMMSKALEPFVGQKVDDVQLEMDEMFDVKVRQQFYSRALELIEEHKKRGDRVILLTASSKYITTPIAKHLGVEFFATSAVEENGRFTDRLNDPIPYKAGKVDAAMTIIAADELKDAWFYSDSHSDMPLLSKVGYPKVVNPDWRLRRAAKIRNWPIIEFDELASSKEL
jgi:HAD superfamily hydrolase (TIGR01490 family)